MAIQKKTKEAAKETKKQEEVINHQVIVKRAKEFDEVILIDLQVNGVMLYGCRYGTYKNKDGEEFSTVNFPSRQGSDKKWYNHCYVKFSSDDIENIEKQIEELI